MALTDGRFGEATGEILLDEVQCKGNETSLADCRYAEVGDHDCAHYEDVGVKCVDNLDITGKKFTLGDHLFLSSTHGRVEYRRGNCGICSLQ